MLKEHYTLHTEPARAKLRDRGRFPNGNIPWNKGKKWDEYMSPEIQRKVKEVGVKNLHPRRIGDRASNGKPVISIDHEGRLKRHETIRHAAKYFGIMRENIGRCCRCNHSGIEPTRSWKRINTDHKYMGIRFYYEDDVQLWSNARRKTV